MSRRNVIISIVLVSVFSIALLMRAFASKYGFFLNEFDPYYDYRAANFIVNSFDQSWKAGAGGFPGLLKYFSWVDYSTWFPEGRSVAVTSQDGLQFAGALFYIFFRNVLGLRMSLYDFLVLFPIFLGALTAMVFYFVVKRIAGVAGGLFAALMVAVSPPLIERGNLGWFKSEPLAIFLFAIASYLLLTLVDSNQSLRQRIFRSLLAGLLIGYANTSWGGALYFNVAIGIYLVVIAFLPNVDLSKLVIAVPLFTAADIFASAIFPRPGVGFVTNPAGLLLIGGTLFILVASWLRTWTRPSEYKWTAVKVLAGFILSGLALVSFGLVSSLSARYTAAILPGSRSNNPLVQSVAEHFVPTGGDYFSAYLILLFLSIFGAIVAFRRRSPAVAYALVIGIALLYTSAAYSRLLVYSSIGLAILGGIGFAELAFSIVKPTGPSLTKKKPAYTSRNEARAVYSVAFIALIALSASIYWIPNPVPCSTGIIFCDQSPADSGVSLSNGGTVFARSQLTDWTQALQWIRDNTPTNAVVIAWWDYGYWITVMGNRTSVADNATLNSTRIAEIGRMFMSNTTVAAKMAKDMAHGRPVYVLTFITGSLLGSSGQQQYYSLQIPSGGGFTAGGGDESKKQWFIRIGGLNETKYLQPPPDDFNLTPLALQGTLFGKLLPFTFAGYLDTSSTSASISPTYALGSNGSPPLQLFSAPFNFQFGLNSTPFRVVFHSSSLDHPTQCSSNAQCFSTVLIYQVV
jgi:dolichyl-diphosphooligosaccharide--protein glycosyltransferase